MASDARIPSFEDVVARSNGHIPVMPREVLSLLALAPGDIVVDCTAGGGGHLRLLADAVAPSGRVIAFDRDPRAHLEDAAGGVARSHAARIDLVQRPFAELEAVLRELDVEAVDAVFADLGVSSFQLDERARGFSFRGDAPLDMRMDPTRGETAAELIGRLGEEELAHALFSFGGEGQSRRIAHAIKVATTPVVTTRALAEIVTAATGGPKPWLRIHPATKTFQALRIAVNGELDELDTMLSALPRVLKASGGRAAILSFHSLEDARVKVAFKEQLVTLTKRPLTAASDELSANPRSRSARLRAARTGEPMLSKREQYAQKLAAKRASTEQRAQEDEQLDDDGVDDMDPDQEDGVGGAS